MKALRFHVIIFNGAAAEVYLASQILSSNAHSVKRKADTPEKKQKKPENLCQLLCCLLGS